MRWRRSWRPCGHELDEDGAANSQARSLPRPSGNPFFVGEILRGLSESGALAFDEASGALERRSSSAGVALPESVREVIERRVERLGEDAQRGR